MTDVIFDLLEDPSGQQYLYIHTGDTMTMLEVGNDDIDELRDTLDESPSKINGLGLIEK